MSYYIIQPSNISMSDLTFIVNFCLFSLDSNYSTCTPNGVLNSIDNKNIIGFNYYRPCSYIDKEELDVIEMVCDVSEYA